MSSSVMERREKCRSPPQPLDRHLSEISECDGTIYINAGIDSTCCKKPVRVIHTLTNGIMVSTTKPRNSNDQNDDLSPVLSNSRTHDDRFDSINNRCCVHCGK